MAYGFNKPDSDNILGLLRFISDDIPAMSEAFNDWIDSECKDGRLSFAQYHDYCYVGRYES